jgi:hypothetical protein
MNRAPGRYASRPTAATAARTATRAPTAPYALPTFAARSALRTLAACGLLAVLAACGSAPTDISLPNARTAAADTGDVKVESVKWKRTKPGCKGDCPSIEVDSVAFPGIPKLTALIDHVLSYMTGLDRNLRGPYDTLDEYADYFWKTARPHDATYFKASVKDTVGDVIAIELHTEQTITGGAHPIPSTQYLNWQRATGRVLALDEIIIPGRRPQFITALRQAHGKWLAGNDDAKRDRAAYTRLWPFVDNDNFALTKQGITVKYDAYTIAPYVYGEPELSIPYTDLVGILRPEYLPRKN